MKIRSIALVSVLALGLTAASDCDQGPQFSQDYPLDRTVLRVLIGGGPATGEVPLDLTVGFGSAAFHRPGDDPHEMVTCSDRGPNIDSGDIDDFYGADKSAVSGSGKYFPTPNFSPTIYRLRVAPGHFDVLDVIQLKDRQARPLPGYSTGTESTFDGWGNLITGEDHGLDTEGIVHLHDGTYWLADEYGPSLIHVGADGRVIDRLMPFGHILNLTRYDVETPFPAILNKRRLNRGFEAVAVSDDETKLFTILQSPLEHPTRAIGRASRNLRLFVVDRLSQTVVGEYAYRMELPTAFLADRPPFTAAEPVQGDVKVSEMTALPSGKLLVLERVNDSTKLFLVDLAGATEISGLDYDLTTTSPAFEELDLGSSATVIEVTKTLLFDSDTLPWTLSPKVEGVAYLGHGNFLLINDNDFGTTGAQTTISRILIKVNKLD